jgi:hypothetical protein
MQDPNQIWAFGRWIAQRDPGSARLTWTGGEVVLGVRQGRIHSAEGLDSDELAGRLGCGGSGEADLFAEARLLGQSHDIAETRAMGAAKEILQEALHQWLLDPERQFSVDDSVPPEADGATISITHALVELVLADTEHNVAESILPDSETTLQRSASFIELYAPLRLTEEADLIVANITGSATAAAIADESSHHPDEVVRLVAALVTTGILEASEPVVLAHDLEWPGTELEEDEPSWKKIPGWMIGAAVGLLLITVMIIAFVLMRGDGGEATVAVGSGDWGVVVEMGCEPRDLQRMLRKRNLERKALRTVKADPTNGDMCFRLVWGSFPTREAAEESVGDIPSNLVEDGFQPHVIEVTGTEADGELGIED